MTPAGLIGVGVLQALLLLVAAPLFSGFARVLRAKIQNRKGPPVLQNYLDLTKLMKRQEVVSEQAGWVFHAAPYVLMSTMLLVALLLPVLAVQSPLGEAGDLILLIYLFALPRFFLSLAGLDSGSPFGGIGSRRELFISALVEPVLLLVVFVMALLAGSTNLGTISSKVTAGALPPSMAFWLGLAAFAFASFIEMGKLPFDLAEAEQELQEGPLAEYSGRSLAILKWGLYLRQLVLAALFLALFLPFGSMRVLSPAGALLAIAAFLLKAVVFYLIAAVLENAMARIRFMKSPATIWFALGAAVLSFVFYLAHV
ncbi:MAG: NADH-quinone oxidoreductase subunit H [Anaerolineales bacterium]|nr:NADH-quinone oxidoreductase subunit H [Anaerolineales bacterium]